MANDFEKGKWSKYNELINKYLKEGHGPSAVASIMISERKVHELDFDGLRLYVSRFRKQLRDLKQYKSPAITTDKKEPEFHWRNIIAPMQEIQRQTKAASGSQDHGSWKINTKERICVLVLGDTQLGSYATNYDSFVKITDEIINTPNLYVVLVGDILQMAIKLRGVAEVADMLITPQMQMMFLESWLGDIKHKVICSTWDNHSVMRQEDQAGSSAYAELFKRLTIYHSGIGHIDITVGDQTYKWAVSHFFAGKSMLNRVHAPQRYMRMEAPFVDVAVQGDFHCPGMSKYYEGGKNRIAIVCGTIQTDSTYAKRFFSLFTQDNMPCVILHPTEHVMTPYYSLKEWRLAEGR